MLKTCENEVATCIANRAQSHDSNPRTLARKKKYTSYRLAYNKTSLIPPIFGLLLTFSLAHSSRDLRAESVNLTYTTLLPVFGREERARACPSASTAMSTELNWWGPGSSTPARTARHRTH